MKHAYLIMAHGQWELLQILLDCIDDERNDIYVHIDAKVRELPELHTVKGRLFILENRVDVRWADVSVVEAEYALFEVAFTRAEEYSYFHLLSGADLPLRSQDFIHNYFKIHGGEEFVGYTELKLGAKSIRKVYRWHLFPRFFKSKSLMIRGIRMLYLRFQETLGIYRNLDEDFQKGTQWVSITPDLVREVINRKQWALKTFSHTFCADEIFVQTICWQSPMREHIHSLESDACGCLRAIGWEDGCLYDWKAEDYDFLKESDALFARKFNLEDRVFINKIVALSKNDKDNEGSPIR